MIKEIELKYRLHDAASLERVKNAALARADKSEIVTRTQTNYFFDTNGHSLKSNRVTLRLRHEGERHTLCIKGDDPNTPKTPDTLSVKLEYERILDHAHAHQLLALTVSPIELLAIDHIHDDKRQNQTRAYLFEQARNLAKARPIILVGSFSNLRSYIPIQMGSTKLTLELDETRFGNNIVHHEVELELPASADLAATERDLLTLFDEAQVQFFSSSGKAERFYNLLTSGQL